MKLRRDVFLRGFLPRYSKYLIQIEHFNIQNIPMGILKQLIFINMKHLSSILLIGLTTLFFTACKNVDSETVGKIQADITAFEGGNSALEAPAKALADLRSKAAGASATEQAFTQYQAFNNMLLSAEGKIGATGTEYQETVTELKNLLADYEAGKIKTEEVKAKYETLTAELKAKKELFGRIERFIGGLGTEYETMLADVKTRIAKGEKPVVAEPMPAGTQPSDAMKGGSPDSQK
jgi:hypothetical protein